ncbi:hypothetical protein N7478_008863 [Penicillium angulare]|uniref:uncharacterized protein n=1 Tax=Penicillium angulare TaxID=116970 RepID=UPI00253F9804|nr:uncharacterized protein N7478_008863 [Penicillium angulare]KAJ5273738.1 hypothetical protein N7478_008863 [Penicillium angulare]
MPESPSHSYSAQSIAGGAGLRPTPANNVGGGSGWGDNGFRKGGTDSDDEDSHQDFGHGTEPQGVTMADAMKSQQHKIHAKYGFLDQSESARHAAHVKPMSQHGEPTCASEDHSFMNHKPGGSRTMPGWGTMRNLMGA